MAKKEIEGEYETDNNEITVALNKNDIQTAVSILHNIRGHPNNCHTYSAIIDKLNDSLHYTDDELMYVSLTKFETLELIHILDTETYVVEIGKHVWSIIRRLQLALEEAGEDDEYDVGTRDNLYSIVIVGIFFAILVWYAVFT